ncbi:MAG TPA: hypothetical protein VNV60_04205 [Holophagaceae bacterium]|jgi:hypothetical protein|nr:hypothetical protein [Holophagaceae bacterium]
MSGTSAFPGGHPETVSAALAQLAAEGYTADFSSHGHDLHCRACGKGHAAEGAQVEKVYRFEGASDPDDQAIVLGLRCPECGVKGVLVSGYGPSTDPGEIAFILSLADGR